MLAASIVIPTYNQRAEFLEAAVTSALQQTAPCEVLIVDDGSSTPVETSDPRVRVIRHSHNQGVAAALNSGIAAMQTDWFAWLPSDDLYAPRKIEIQRAAMIEAGSLAGFHQYYTFQTNASQPLGQSIAWDWSSQLKQRRQLGVGCAINGLTVMLHRDVFRVCGDFDTSYRYGQDWEAWARIALTYEWLGMDAVLAYRRQSGENLTATIARDPELRAVRDAEDARIAKRYGI